MGLQLCLETTELKYLVVERGLSKESENLDFSASSLHKALGVIGHAQKPFGSILHFCFRCNIHLPYYTGLYKANGIIYRHMF